MGYGYHQSVKTVSHSFFAILEKIILRLLHFSSIHKGTYDTFYGWYCADFRRSLPVSVCGCTVLCPFPASCMESGHLRSRYQTSIIQLAPKKAAISRVTGGKRSLTVKYGRISRVNGYEVYVSKRKGSGYKLAATVKKGTATKATAKRLTRKKTYFVKVRAYISTKSGKVYGAYSSPKKVRVK